LTNNFVMDISKASVDASGIQLDACKSLSDVGKAGVVRGKLCTNVANGLSNRVQFAAED
jgi:hypothetical protein